MRDKQDLSIWEQYSPETWKVCKIVGAQNSKMSTKMNFIGTKVLRRWVSVNVILGIIRYLPQFSTAGTMAEDYIRNLRSLPVAPVKIVKQGGNEDIKWSRAGKPTFHESRTRIELPSLRVNSAISVPETSKRMPDLGALEFCLIRHALPHSRMTVARGLLMELRTRDEVATELIDPWRDHIAQLFNEEYFHSLRVHILGED